MTASSETAALVTTKPATPTLPVRTETGVVSAVETLKAEYERLGERLPDISALWGWLGKLYCRVGGWSVDAVIPDIDKAVLIAAPHTSNWDLPHMIAATCMHRVKVQWFGKHTIFTPPFGSFMKMLGGIPVDRRARHNIVDQLVRVIGEADRMILAVPAAGTRSRQEYWKSGFYWIAHGAGVPIALGYEDYAKKVCGIGGLIYPTGDVRADMDLIRDFYATRDPKGKYPDKASRIRLRAEDDEKLLPG